MPISPPQFFQPHRHVLGFLLVISVILMPQDSPAAGETITSADIGNGDRFVVSLDKQSNPKGEYHIDVVGANGQTKARWGSFSARLEPSNSPIYVRNTSFASSQDGVAALILDTGYAVWLLRGRLNAPPDSYHKIELTGLQKPIRENERRTFEFPDPYHFNIIDENLTTGEKRRRNIEVNAAGERFLNGEPYDDAMGALQFTPQPDGTYLMRDPKGLYGPPGGTHVIDPRKAKAKTVNQTKQPAGLSKAPETKRSLEPLRDGRRAADSENEQAVRLPLWMVVAVGGVLLMLATVLFRLWRNQKQS